MIRITPIVTKNRNDKPEFPSLLVFVAVNFRKFLGNRNDLRHKGLQAVAIHFCRVGGAFLFSLVYHTKRARSANQMSF